MAWAAVALAQDGQRSSEGNIHGVDLRPELCGVGPLHQPNSERSLGRYRTPDGRRFSVTKLDDGEMVIPARMVSGNVRWLHGGG